MFGRLLITAAAVVVVVAPSQLCSVDAQSVSPGVSIGGGGRIDIEQSTSLTSDATRGITLDTPPTRSPQRRMRGGESSPGFRSAKKRHLAKSVKEALVALERLDEDTKLHLLRQPKVLHSSHVGDDVTLTPPQAVDDLSLALQHAREDALCLSTKISSVDTNDEKDPLPEDLFAPTEEELRNAAMKTWKLEILKVRQERINDTRSRAFALFGAFTAQKV